MVRIFEQKILSQGGMQHGRFRKKGAEKRKTGYC